MSTGFIAQNSTVYVTIPTTTNTVPVISVNKWLIIFSRVDSTFQTGLSDTNYQAGFGDIKANFWLGLNQIYYLTNPDINGGQTYRLRFEMLFARNRR